MAGENPDKPQNNSRDSRPFVGGERRDALGKEDQEGSAHISEDRLEPSSDDSVSLTADVSAEVAPVVEEFMGQAAQQNEAAAEAVPR